MLRNVLTTVWCRFGSCSSVIEKKFCSDFEHKVWSRIWSWSSGEILNTEVWSVFCCWCIVEVMKFNLDRDTEGRFGQDFETYVLWSGWFFVEILKLMLDRDSEDEIWSRFVFKLVIWTQPSGPLCLWQCFQSIDWWLDCLDRVSAVTCWGKFLVPSLHLRKHQRVCMIGGHLDTDK